MSQNNKYIGGFFELELPKNNNVIHNNAIALSNGRACLNLIIKQIKPVKVYLPFYTCDALFSPLENKNINFEFYAINENFEPINLPKIKSDELLIYINYFGIKDTFSNALSNKYQQNVIIDNTHQFFHYGYENSFSFTSARKHFGVPDGAYLYGKIDSDLMVDIKENKNISIVHHIQRLLDEQVIAYQNYLKYEASLTDEITYISKLSRRLLQEVNYKKVQKTRLENYKTLHDGLGKYNLIALDNSPVQSPFCYPLLLKNPINRKLFYNNNIFIPTLWGDILKRDCSTFKQEVEFTTNILPLPIDHRYSESEMKEIINFINEYVYEA
ncbi:MAG: hypothetical protein ACI89T_000459 [Cognaticolwellia sp.]|jgi:hypothetical protein